MPVLLTYLCCIFLLQNPVKGMEKAKNSLLQLGISAAAYWQQNNFLPHEKEHNRESFLSLNCKCKCLEIEPDCDVELKKTPISWKRLKNELELLRVTYKTTMGLAQEQDEKKTNRIYDFFQTSKPSYWVGKTPDATIFSDATKDAFLPFAQKLLLPEDSKIAFKGDIHGDIYSLLDFIQYWQKKGYIGGTNGLTIINRTFYIIFLGDFTDRGWWGAEVLYTIWVLKNCNPDNVFMVRGNHEEYDLNKRYGFVHELETKFPNENHDLIYTFYHYLPTVIYLGCTTPNGFTTDYIQCCHGGIEPGYDPQRLLMNTGTRAFEFIAIHKRTETIETVFKKNNFQDYTAFIEKLEGKTNEIRAHGFLWADFCADENTPFHLDTKTQRIAYGKKATHAILAYTSELPYKICAIFRGHQHAIHHPNNPQKDELMEQRILNIDQLSHPDDTGVGKLWIPKNSNHQKKPGLLNGIKVVTFAVSPHLLYNYPKNYFGLLTLKKMYNKSTLEVHKTDAAATF